MNTDKDSIKEIIKEAKTEDISKNLIYVCNEKDQITHMMVEICNTKTNNLDYVTIPTKNDYTIPTTMYRKLCTISENIPQIMRISKLKQYFADEQKTVDVEQTASPVASASPEPSGAKTKMKISCASDAYVQQLKDLNGDESKIADFIKSQYDRVTSNLTVTNKIGYIQSYEQMNVDYFHYWGCPGSYDGKVFVVDTKAAKKFFKGLINNEVPYTAAQDLTTTQKATTSPAASSNTTPKPKSGKKAVSSKGLKIILLNGSKIAGLAGKTQQKLQKKGYTVPQVGDYTKETLTQTKIIVKEDGQGEDLKKYFKNPQVTVGMVDQGYDIEIILGTADANQ